MAAEQIQLRCSALPLAFKCPGSVRPGPVVINETSEAAEMGTAAHEGLARLVETGRVDWDSVPALAKKHGVNEPELRMLLANGAKLWEQTKDSFPNAMTEVELSTEDAVFALTGHADILGRSANVAHLGDWKTGRKDSDYSQQLKGYAALALCEDRSLDSATAGVLWVRDCEYEHYTMPRSDLHAWLMQAAAEIDEWDGTYRPGPHCAHCPRNIDCPAANALVRRDVAAIANTDLNETVLAKMTADEKIDVLQKADLVVKFAERVRGAIRADVIKNGDVVGTTVRLTVQHEERRHMNVLATFPILEASDFNDDDMAQVIEISASKVERVVAAKAGKGQGAKAVRSLREKLDAAGAINIDTVTKLVTRRA